MLNKKWKQILAFSLMAVMLCGCQSSDTDVDNDTTKNTATEEATGDETTEDILASKYDFTKESTLKMKNFFEYMPRATVVGVKNGTFLEVPSKNGYFVMQGGCTDGIYAYCILEGQNVEVDGTLQSTAHMIFKIDMNTWEIVAESKPLLLGHGNSITYNSKLGQLIVSNYSPDPKEITFVDPNTLTIVGNKILNQNITGIAYNATHDQYVVANGSAQFSILDAEFNEVAYVEGHHINMGTQDIDCDDNYIYVGNSGVVSNPGVEVVKIYDWNGEYKGIFRVDSVNEQEAIFNCNGKYYITFYTGNGGRLFEIQYDFDMLDS